VNQIHLGSQNLNPDWNILIRFIYFSVRSKST